MNSQILFSKSQIQKRVGELAKLIAHDFKNENPIIIGVLNGSYIFMSDLTQKIWESGLTDFQVDFVGVSSYENSSKSNTKPKLTRDTKIDIKGRNIILLEDIYDTGYTLDYLLTEFMKRSPKTIKVASFLSKKDCHKIDIQIDYLGFEINNVWVEGYGLDSAEFGRANPNIIKKQTT